MAVHRKGARKPQPPRNVSRVTVLGALGGTGGGDLAAAAQIIAAEARRISAAWSRQVPARITVSVSGNVATITADAPPARPAELRLRHPLFGDREHWYGPPGEPFLAPAADAAGDQAMTRYAKKIDRMCAQAGYR
jgi:hypothetical protein